jgi:hypothetical protein
MDKCIKSIFFISVDTNEKGNVAAKVYLINDRVISWMSQAPNARGYVYFVKLLLIVMIIIYSKYPSGIRRSNK